ncbi:MAG TPA: methionyl-tRNA formyltransferase, partial [Dehalococcoidia bacterium]|nr:methionyl-tRNA formyltransferase [Dehalococcoidia bacterium]
MTDAARLVFMGSPEFAVPSLRRLLEARYDIVAVYTQPDRQAGRGRHLQPPPVKQAALEAGLPVFQPETLRRPEAVAELASLHPDAIVVVAFGQVLRPPVLQIPGCGVLNVHASLLPRHRGASPVAGALLAGDEAAGVSIMLLDAGLDTGPVLAQRAEAILPEDTAGSLTDRLANLGAGLLVETLPAWLTGKLAPSAQDERQATLTRRVNKEDGRIDWSRPAREIWSRIRAYTPWPGAMTSLNGTPLQILQAWPAAGGDDEPAGTVLPLAGAVDVPASLPPPAFAVQTGDGILLPLVLKRAG